MIDAFLAISTFLFIFGESKCRFYCYGRSNGCEVFIQLFDCLFFPFSKTIKKSVSNKRMWMKSIDNQWFEGWRKKKGFCSILRNHRFLKFNKSAVFDNSRKKSFLYLHDIYTQCIKIDLFRDRRDIKKKKQPKDDKKGREKKLNPGILAFFLLLFLFGYELLLNWTTYSWSFHPFISSWKYLILTC